LCTSGYREEKIVATEGFVHEDAAEAFVKTTALFANSSRFGLVFLA
jgi:hypothetical protein